MSTGCASGKQNAFDSAFLCVSTSGEVAQSPQTWEKEICAAAHSDELRQARNTTP